MSTTVQESVPSASVSDPIAVVHAQPSANKKRRREAFVLLFIAWVLLALLLGLTLGSGIFSFPGGKRVPASSQRPSHYGTATVSATPTTRSTPTQAALTPVTKPPTAQPTPVPPSVTYPLLLRSYNGSITNQYSEPPVTTSMNLANIQQTGGNIRGYFTVGAELEGNGNFNGNVTTDRKIRFLVDSYRGNLPLFFAGTIHPDGSMSGTYCSYQNWHCSSTAGYGVWNVNPDYLGS